MPINAETIKSLKTKDTTLLDGPLKSGLEMDFLDAVREPKSSHLILGDLKKDDFLVCAKAFISATVKTITVCNLEDSLVFQLAKILEHRVTPMRLIFEDFKDEPAIQCCINTLCTKKIDIQCSLNTNWHLSASAGPTIDELQYRILYNNKLVVLIVSIDKQLTHLELDESALQTTATLPEQANTPYAGLINFIIGHINTTDSDKLCWNVIADYFNGLMPDYLHWKYNPFITTNGQGLSKETNAELQTVLEQEGILFNSPHLDFQLNSNWLRDELLCLGNGRYLINAGYLISKSVSDQTINIFSAYSPASSFAKSKIYTPLNNVNYGNGIVKSSSYMEGILKSQQIPYQKMECLLEGGNILTLNANQKLVLIGKTSIVITAQFRLDHKLTNLREVESFNKIKSKNPVNQEFYDFLKESNFPLQKGHIKEAKNAILKQLNITRAQGIFFDQFFWHGDLGIVAMDGFVLLNSFRLAIEILKKVNSRVAQSIISANTEMHNLFAPYLAKTRNKLHSKGIRVVEVPLFYMRNQEGELICVANLENGFAGTGKKGRFYITGVPCCTTTKLKLINKDKEIEIPEIDEACEQAIFNSFDTILKKNRVDNIYYLGDTLLSYKFFNIYGGWIRCLSISGSFLSHFAPKQTANNASRNNNNNSDDINNNNSGPSVEPRQETQPTFFKRPTQPSNDKKHPGEQSGCNLS